MRLFLGAFVLLAAVSLTVAEAKTDKITIEYTNDAHPLFPDYVFSCKKVGFAKLQAQAKSYGINVDMGSLRMTNFSSNPIATYIHWTVDVTNIGTRTDLYPAGKPQTLTKITQKPLRGNCF